MISLAVFLGNPGIEYACNRHNVGQFLVERLPFYNDLTWKKKFKGRYAALGRCVPLNTEDSRYFLIPETYMNLSGVSVKAAAKFYSLKADNIIAVHDELELPLGYYSLKFGGGLGGHNGLRSIKETVGTADFWRLRVGIGRPPGRLPGEGGRPVKGANDGGDGLIAQWVLSDFDSDEADIVVAVLKECASLLVRALSEEPTALLPEFKKKKAAL